MKQKKTHIWHYLSLKNLKREIEHCGYHFSIVSFLKYVAAVLAGISGLSYFYKLHVQYMIFIMIVFAIFMPNVFLMTYRNMYEKKRFEDITSYMEQLLYSFKRQPKILSALEDTMTLFETREEEQESRLYLDIAAAVEHIRTGIARENIYRESFAIIEKDYGCKRLAKIHNYLMNVESAGGNSLEAVDVLLGDRKLWIDRVYEYLRQKKDVKVKVTICIALSFLICGLAVHMLPVDFGISENMLSQSVTAGVVVVNVLLWYVVQRQLSGSILDEEDDTPFSQLKRSYDFVLHADLKKEKKKAVMKALIISPLIIVMWKMTTPAAAGFTIALVCLIATQPDRKYKSSFKRIRKEVEKVFPEWLLNMSLQLQTDNVYVSIVKTSENAPEIMKEELDYLITGIELNPDSIYPYTGFMRKLDIPDITSAMKILYAMARFGSADVQQQIQSLVQRNTMLMDRSEKIKMEDRLSGIGFIALVPMLTGVVKMLVDLAILIIQLMTLVDGI